MCYSLKRFTLGLHAAAAAAKLLQSCLTLCEPIDRWKKQKPREARCTFSFWSLAEVTHTHTHTHTHMHTHTHTQTHHVTPRVEQM